MAQNPGRKKQRVVIWTLRWGNPYTRPPEWQPAVLGLQITSRTSEQPAALYSLKKLGDGYAMYCEVHDASARARNLPEATKKKIRRRNLARRIETQAPLFKAELFAREVAAKSGYFGSEPA